MVGGLDLSLDKNGIQRAEMDCLGLSWTVHQTKWHKIPVNQTASKQFIGQHFVFVPRFGAEWEFFTAPLEVESCLSTGGTSRNLIRPFVQGIVRHRYDQSIQQDSNGHFC